MLGGLRTVSPLEKRGDTVVDLEVDMVGSDSRLDWASWSSSRISVPTRAIDIDVPSFQLVEQLEECLGTCRVDVVHRSGVDQQLSYRFGSGPCFDP